MSSNGVDGDSSVENYDKVIDKLYEFRDKYYIINTKSNVDDRNRDLNEKLNEVLNSLEEVKDKFESLPSYLSHVGRAYNVLPEYSQKAFEALSKAVKLDPNCYDAWNYLGECYWKKRDFEAARNCFLKSLSICKNKLSLRSLSMVNRHLASQYGKKQTKTNTNETSTSSTQNKPQNSIEELKSLVEDSVKYAKEALQLDLKDGMSWYILANSYLAQFFSPFRQNNSGLLKQAISAYNLALKDESVASLQSDLYYNKSMTSLYEENWPDVLHCLTKALQLDPNWQEVKENLRGVLDYLSQMQSLIESQGKLKAKRFKALIESIGEFDFESNSGNYSLKKADDIKPVVSTLKELSKGLNLNRILLCKVISGMPVKSTENFTMICFTCCIADKNGDCAALTIYNLSSGEGVIIGDTIAIPEPWLEKFDFEYSIPENVILNEADQAKKFKYDSIRVENPSFLIVNGKKWTKDKVASAVFVPKVIDD